MESRSAMDFSDLPKIPMKDIDSVPISERLSWKTMDEYRHIYAGLTFLFIGDSSVRTIYFDLCKMLSTGRILDYTQAARQNGSRVVIEGETIILNSGAIGSDEYMDCRRFYLAESVTDVYFMFIPTLFHDKADKCLALLKTLPARPYFDVIITSCYLSDMNYRKIERCGISYDDYLKQYKDNLKTFLHQMRKAKRFPCLKESTKLFWLTPMPQNLEMDEDRMESFLKISKKTDEIAEEEHYQIIDRLETWMKRNQELVTKQTGHLSHYGVRVVNDVLVNRLSILLNRKYYQEALPNKGIKDEFNKRADAAGWFGKDCPGKKRSMASQPIKRHKN